MASDPVIDFDALLAPIPGDNPVGVYLRSDGTLSTAYHALKDLAAANRKIERDAAIAGEDEGAAKPDWSKVIDQCSKLLREKTKDLEVASWLLEGLVREHGFAGLRDGFKLYRQLIELHWDAGIYPTPDDDEGPERRVASLAGLNGESGDGILIAPMKRLAVTNSAVGAFGLLSQELASDLDKVSPEERQRRIDRGVATEDLIRQSAGQTPPQYFTRMLEDLAACRQEFDKLCDIVESKCSSNAPPSSNIRNTIEAIENLAKELSGPVLGAASAGGGGDENMENDGGGAGASRPVGKISTREQAFKTLLDVAQFFRNTEPHSPLPYQLEQAVKWGRMSLPDLLSELLQEDSSVRDKLFQRVGIPKPPEG
jgi:type VI secretion system protein ImpA